MTCIVLDGQSIRRRGRGVARVLRQVLPLLAAEQSGVPYVVLTTLEGKELLGPCASRVVTVPQMSQTRWEQFGLPWHARKIGATAVYSHAECGPLWGPPVLLHVPEDPYVRWEGAGAASSREYIRRRYESLVMRRSIRRSPHLVTSSEAIARALRARFGVVVPPVSVVPLGVDLELFHPASDLPRETTIFHLGSSEQRDQSRVVVDAYAEALRRAPDLPDLVIGGDLGERAWAVTQAIDALGLDGRVHLVGRISDEELRASYANAAMCVQPARYEGFGLQPLEALACGAPLIVSPEPAVEEVVAGAAVVTDESTPPALAAAMVSLWQDAAKRAELRWRGPERANQYTWSSMAKQLSVLLQSLATGTLLIAGTTSVPGASTLGPGAGGASAVMSSDEQR